MLGKVIGRLRKKAFFYLKLLLLPFPKKPHHCGGEQFYFILSHPQTLSEEELGRGKVSSPFRLWMMWNRALMIKILSATIKSCCFFFPSVVAVYPHDTISNRIAPSTPFHFGLPLTWFILRDKKKFADLIFFLAQIPLPPTGGGVEWNGILTFHILSRLAFEKWNLYVCCCLLFVVVG